MPTTGLLMKISPSTLINKVHMRLQVANDIRTIFASGYAYAAKNELDRFIEAYQRQHRKRITNMLERQNNGIKRRIRVTALFPNEASLLRLVTAVLVELSVDWETGMRYLTFKKTENRNRTH